MPVQNARKQKAREVLDRSDVQPPDRGTREDLFGEGYIRIKKLHLTELARQAGYGSIQGDAPNLVLLMPNDRSEFIMLKLNDPQPGNFRKVREVRRFTREHVIFWELFDEPLLSCEIEPDPSPDLKVAGHPSSA